jgi:hypothetical protein
LQPEAPCFPKADPSLHDTSSPERHNCEMVLVSSHGGEGGINNGHNFFGKLGPWVTSLLAGITLSHIWTTLSILLQYSNLQQPPCTYEVCIVYVRCIAQGNACRCFVTMDSYRSFHISHFQTVHEKDVEETMYKFKTNAVYLSGEDHKHAYVFFCSLMCTCLCISLKDNISYYNVRCR